VDLEVLSCGGAAPLIEYLQQSKLKMKVLLEKRLPSTVCSEDGEFLLGLLSCLHCMLSNTRLPIAPKKKKGASSTVIP